MTVQPPNSTVHCKTFNNLNKSVLFSPVHTCSEPRRVQSHPRQFVSPSPRDLFVLSASALDRSFSLVASNFQFSIEDPDSFGTFNFQPSPCTKSFSCNLQKTRGVGILPILEESARSRRRGLAFLSSSFLSHSCALFCTRKNSTLFFSSDSALFTREHPGEG